MNGMLNMVYLGCVGHQKQWDISTLTFSFHCATPKANFTDFVWVILVTCLVGKILSQGIKESQGA